MQTLLHIRYCIAELAPFPKLITLLTFLTSNFISPKFRVSFIRLKWSHPRRYVDPLVGIQTVYELQNEMRDDHESHILKDCSGKSPVIPSSILALQPRASSGLLHDDPPQVLVHRLYFLTSYTEDSEILRSFSTLCSHLRLCLPVPLVPWGLEKVIFLHSNVTFPQVRFPSHLGLPSFTAVTILGTLYKS